MLETIFDPSLEVGEWRGKRVTIYLISFEPYLQVWFAQNAESKKQSLTIVKILTFKIENANKCLHDICVHFSWYVLITFVIIVESKDRNFGILESSRLFFNLRVFLFYFFKRSGFLFLFGGKNVLKKFFFDGCTMKISVADDIGPCDVHLSLFGASTLQKEL